MKHGIVIPCYNEAERLELARFKKFLLAHREFHVCFVNDGSSDDTQNVLNSFCNPIANAHAYHMPENAGKAEAVRRGTLFFAEQPGVESIGFLDADLSTDFHDYKRLLNKLESDDLTMVLGSRYENGRNNIQKKWYRKAAGYIVKSFIQTITGININDTQCGAKVYRPYLAQIAFSVPFETRWLFDVEILMRIKTYFGNNFMSKILEVPLLKWVHVDGSKISLRESITVPMMITKLAMHYARPSAKKVFTTIEGGAIPASISVSEPAA